MPRRRPTALVVAFLAAAGFASPFGARAQAPAELPFRNPELPVEKRIDDLLGRLTLDEKVSLMIERAAPVDRLAVPSFPWWNEALHGVARTGRATVFPQAIALAAAWDTDLMLRVATAISDEARAMNNMWVSRDKRNLYQGLVFWSPNINIVRDPRWGRGQETYGEDPFLTGAIGTAFVRGMQGTDPRYLKTVATAKHYAVHSGPESLRHTFDARVSESDLRETYLPAFRDLVVNGKAESVMCSYNSFRGQPACGNDELLGKVLRQEWGFAGYVVSDCGAVIDIHESHKARKSAAEGAAMALLAGTDLECGAGSWIPGAPDSFQALGDAVGQGLVKESDLDLALRRLFRAQVKLGVYDPPSRLPWAGYTYETIVNSPKHQQLALEAARKSIVLLKNENGTLPLKKDLRSIAVIGPSADEAEVLSGNYNGTPIAPVTVLAGDPGGGGAGDEGDLRPGRAARHRPPGPARRARIRALHGPRRRSQAGPLRRLLRRPLRRRARARARGRGDRLRLGGRVAQPPARRRFVLGPLDGRDHGADDRPVHPRRALRDRLPSLRGRQARRPGPLRPRADHDHRGPDAARRAVLPHPRRARAREVRRHRPAPVGDAGRAGRRGGGGGGGRAGRRRGGHGPRPELATRGRGDAGADRGLRRGRPLEPRPAEGPAAAHGEGDGGGEGQARRPRAAERQRPLDRLGRRERARHRRGLVRRAGRGAPRSATCSSAT